MDSTPSHGPEPRTVGTRGETLPVDPDLPQAERVPERQQASPSGGVGRRRARPRPMWGRLARVVVRRRDVLAVIAVGGALGSLGRWGVAEALPHAAGAFAWSTFVTNVSGCFLIGLLMVFVIDVWPPSRYLRPFFGVGVLGGYTTFSTAMLDTRTMLVSGNPGAAGAYLVGSLATGLAAVWVAVLSARGLVTVSRSRRNRRGERPPASDVSRHGLHPADSAKSLDRSDPADRSDRASRRTP
ncbi:MAG: fluoride efflux transporter FluC [Kineosporiaceae bacterium]